MTSLNTALITFYDKEGVICAEHTYVHSFFTADWGIIEKAATEWAKEELYNFYADSHYRYTDNHLYDLNVPNSKAYGYSSHLSLYLAYENISFLFLANDLSGKLYWDELPYSIVHLSSDNKTSTSPKPTV